MCRLQSPRMKFQLLLPGQHRHCFAYCPWSRCRHGRHPRRPLQIGSAAVSASAVRPRPTLTPPPPRGGGLPQRHPGMFSTGRGGHFLQPESSPYQHTFPLGSDPLHGSPSVYAGGAVPPRGVQCPPVIRVWRGSAFPVHDPPLLPAAAGLHASPNADLVQASSIADPVARGELLNVQGWR